MPRDIQYTKILDPIVQVAIADGLDYEGTYSASTKY